MNASQPAETQPADDTPPPSPRRVHRATPPTGWQFSRPAIVAREVTARLIGPFIGWFLVGPRVVGREHLTALEGPSLICPTHGSHFDFSAIRLALGSKHRKRLTAAADHFATKRSRWLIAAWLGAFAFNRTGRSADSIAAAEGLLAAGWHVVLFPEKPAPRLGTSTRSSRGSASWPATPAARCCRCASSASAASCPRARGGRGGRPWRSASGHRSARSRGGCPRIHRPPGGDHPGAVSPWWTSTSTMV